jgi:glycosyltransferase involved in cell wall biosynthesis
VVPCYNEASRLDGEAFRRFAAGRSALRFLFVDDGSTDDTRRVLETLAARDPEHLGVFTYSPNRGKAEAVRRGVLEALNGGPDLVGFWDADLATPLEEVDRFVARFASHPELEIALGSRVRLLGRQIQRNAARHYFGRVAATAVSIMLHLAVYDTQCGAKMFRATDDLKRVFSEPFVTRWIFDVEILVRWLALKRAATIERLDTRIREMPLEAWHDVSGSRLRLRDFARAPLDLWRIYRRYRP